MCVSGHVNKPGNYEFAFGLTLRRLIYDHCGGVPSGKKVKAVMLSGASSVVLSGSDDILDMALDYDSVAKKGSALGSASIIVMDETVDMSWVLLKTSRFFKHESCGKCTPCREGTYWMLNIMERVGKNQVTKADIDLLNNVASQIQGKCLCPLGEFAVTPMLSGLKIFRADFDSHATDAKAAAKPAPAKSCAEEGSGGGIRSCCNLSDLISFGTLIFLTATCAPSWQGSAAISKKIQMIAHIMQNARFDDVWKYIRLDDIVSNWDLVKRMLWLKSQKNCGNGLCKCGDAVSVLNEV